MKTRLEKIRCAVFTWPYNVSFIVILVLFSIFNVYVNGTYEVLTNLFLLAPWFRVSFIGLLILVACMVSLTLNLSYMRYKELSGAVSVKEGGFASLGTFGAVLGGSCPACIAGFFPALMGVFGSSLSLRDLPLLGLEIQIFSVVLLGVSIWLLTNEPVCKIKFKK